MVLQAGALSKAGKGFVEGHTVHAGAHVVADLQAQAMGAATEGEQPLKVRNTRYGLMAGSYCIGFILCMAYVLWIAQAASPGPHLAAKRRHPMRRLPRHALQIEHLHSVCKLMHAVVAPQHHQFVWLLAVGGGGQGHRCVVNPGSWGWTRGRQLLPTKTGGALKAKRPQVAAGGAAAAVPCNRRVPWVVRVG